MVAVLLAMGACSKPPSGTSASATIDSSGGTVSTASGASVQIPANALSHLTNVTITAAPDAPLPMGKTTVGTPYTFGPEGATFDAPVTVTLPFDPGAVGAGMHPMIVTAPAGTTDFVPLHTTLVDATHVAAQTTHFSTFTVTTVGSNSIRLFAAQDAYRPGDIVSIRIYAEGFDFNFEDATVTVDQGVGTVSDFGWDWLETQARFTVMPTQTTTYTVTVSSSRATLSGQITITIALPPAITRFDATPPAVTAGTTSGLTAVFANGTGTITPGIGSVTSGMTIPVSPAANTTYTLEVVNALGDKTSATTTVSVLPPPSIASFDASPTAITAGDTVMLTAVFDGGTGSVSPFVGAVTSGVPAPGTPITTTEYVLTVTNAAQAAVTARTLVTVVQPPVLTSFTASSTSITAGDMVQLTPVFSNGVGFIDHGVGSVISGIPAVVSPMATTTYMLTVGNSLGKMTSAQVTITVAQIPSISSFTAMPSLITAGASSTLRPIFAGGTGDISPGVGPAMSLSQIMVFPTQTTTYTLTVTSPTGAMVTSNATVNVVPPPNTPSVTGPGIVLPGSTGNTAHVSGDIGLTYACTAGGGTITNGASGTLASGGNAVTFDVTAPGRSQVVISCTETNAAATMGGSGQATFPVMGAPFAPTALVASARVQGAQLSWTAPTDTGGGPISSYVIMPSIGGVAQLPVTTPDAATQFTVPGLTADAAYTFTVAAINVAGTGPPSAPSASVTVSGPPAAAQSTLTAFPASVRADGTSSALLTLTLRDAAGAPVGGQSVTLSATGTQNVFSPSATGSTDGNGIFTASLSSTTAEPKTVTGAGVSTNVTFTGPLCTGVIDFGELPQLIGGSYPVALDLNGDAKLDLVAGNQVTNNVMVFIGKGNGTFAAPLTYPTGVAPLFIAPADLNGDGHVDLAVSNSGGSNVTILLGHGDGTFQSGGSVLSGSGPGIIATGDFNADTFVDLAVVNGNARTVGVLLGKGNGTFQSVVPYSITGSPNAVVAGRFTASGHVDLAISGSQGPIVMLGNGDGTFQAPMSVSTSSQEWIATGDFNRDGRADLAALTGSGMPVNPVVVYLGNGDGTFAAGISYPAGQHANTFAIVDANADGRVDVVAPNDTGFNVLLGNGDGTFGAPTTYVTSAMYTLASGDFDGDSLIDLAMGSAAGVNIVRGRGAGAFAVAPTYSGSAYPVAATTADFNRDNHVDLVTTSDTGVNLYLGQANGTLQAPTTVLPASGTQGVVARDLNGDGLADIAAVSGGLVVLLGKGDGTFQTAQAFSAGSQPSGITAGDLNGDGRPDLIVTNSGAPSNVSVFIGNGDGTFQGAANYTVDATPLSVAAGDLRGSGHLDLVVANQFTSDVSVLLGNGDGTFQPAVNYPAGGSPVSIAVTDLRGVGVLDVVVANRATAGTVSVLAGNGDGTLKAPVAYAVGALPYVVTTSDLNGDGYVDLLTANNNGADISLLLGAGDGGLQPAVSYATGINPTALTVADFAGTGTPGVAVCVFSGVTMLLDTACR
jgi:hypothetical protein